MKRLLADAVITSTLNIKHSRYSDVRFVFTLKHTFCIITVTNKQPAEQAASEATDVFSHVMAGNSQVY